MQTHAIPRWIVFLIGIMYRFVAGGFGISFPHPYRAKICLRFWLVALPGCTVALPLVLLGWIIRLTLGKGRAESFFERIGEIKVPRWLQLVLFVLLIALVLLVLGLLVYNFGWWEVARYVIILAVMIVIYVVVVGGIMQFSFRLESRMRRQQLQEKMPNAAFALVKKACWGILFPFRVLWQILWFTGLILYSIYKKFCPVVEFP